MNLFVLIQSSPVLILLNHFRRVTLSNPFDSLNCSLGVNDEIDDVTVSYQTIFAGNALNTLVRYNVPGCSKNIGDLMSHFASGLGQTCGIKDFNNLTQVWIEPILKEFLDTYG